MKHNLKVSVITVCLNSVQTIERTICSVLKQSYKNIEYIVIDGQSTDGTQEIIEKYKDRIAFYCSEKDNGIYSAMNKGIQQAKGDIVGILNSDDWYTENAVELVVNYLNNGKYDMVHGAAEIVYSDGKTRVQKQEKLSDIYLGMVITHPTVFVRRDIYNQYGGFDEQYKSASDFELMLRWYTRGVRIGYIPETITYFSRGGFSETDINLSADETYDISEKYINEFLSDKKSCYIEKIEKIKSEKKQKYGILKKARTLTPIEKEQLGKRISENKEVVVFGVGGYGLWCYDLFSILGIKILFWLDNDAEKQGLKLLDINICHPDKNNLKDKKIIIGTKDYGREIANQLSNMDICRKNYLFIDEIEKLFA